jgi:sec-independent protein translocase protein TatA
MRTAIGRYAVQNPPEALALFNQIGPLEIGLVIVVLLLIFGPKRLPALGKQLGTGMREFKDSITGDKRHDDDDAEAERPALARAQAPAPAAQARESQPADAPDTHG